MKDPAIKEPVWKRLLVIQHRRLRRLQLPHVSEAELKALQDILLEESRPSTAYFILVIGSSIIATAGLLSNSAAVIIGAMIIAPLMLPIRGIALGILEGNIVLFWIASYSILMGTGLGATTACITGWLVDVNWGNEILARTQPNLLDLAVALAAGVVGSYAKVRRNIADSLAGVAIAVALMPPVCVVGLGLSELDWQISLGALLLYLTNLLGISLACMVTFLVMGYAPFHQARAALVWTIGLVGLLSIPLGASLNRLLAQAELETALRTALLRGTITFNEQVQLLESSFNWVSDPPEVTLVVRANETVTSRQVGLLEQFAEQATGQPFRLVFLVSQTEEVRSDLYPTPTPPPLPDPLPTSMPSVTPQLEPSSTLPPARPLFPTAGPDSASNPSVLPSLVPSPDPRLNPSPNPVSDASTPESPNSSPTPDHQSPIDFVPTLRPDLVPESLFNNQQ